MNFVTFLTQIIGIELIIQACIEGNLVGSNGKFRKLIIFVDVCMYFMNGPKNVSYGPVYYLLVYEI